MKRICIKRLSALGLVISTIVMIATAVTVTLTGCASFSEANEKPTSSSFKRVRDYYMLYYETYTETVGIKHGAGRDAILMNVYYHGYPLYYCAHKDELYYYKDDVKEIISIEDLACEFNEIALTGDDSTE